MNIGILGFAHGHVGMYISRWRDQPEMGINVVAGWDHDAARAEANCTSFGIDRAESVEALLDSDIEAVVIAAETSMHADLVERAAEAGKAIIVQKPIALTMAQADRIVNAVNQSGVPFTLAWQMRVERFNLQAKALMEGSEFGRVFQVRRRHCLATQHMKDFQNMWHVKPELNRDIFADDAAHPIDFIYWLLGKPSSVMCELGTLLNPKIPNDNAIAVFRYPDGKFAEVSCSFVAVAGENTLEILCENGIIIGNYGDGPSNSVRPPDAPQLKWYLHGKGWTISDLPEINGQGERIANLAGPLADFLHGKRPPIATAEEGRDVLGLVLACYESDGDGKRVDLCGKHR
ncbi:MAG TPA: Gfo/Idh/MocA family oxidoreductase [Armatimonadota bacterium]|nr:Gfo/Idh/MocA family oxidoreductase [Armatimonadota bacterium]